MRFLFEKRFCRVPSRRIATVLVAGIESLMCFSTPAHAFDAHMHHYDRKRTGWNASEFVLTPTTVNPATFGLLASISVDEQVDAQPLVVSSVMIDGVNHEVVYIVTENNSVYALDGKTGKQLLPPRQLGTPVLRSAIPGGCHNNSSVVGIGSTPTINTQTNTMYLMAYESVGGRPQYRLHALDLSTLADKPNSPVTVSGTQKLSDGSTYQFNAAVTRQRAALLEANGNIYAAFASYCDVRADVTRGWILGWKEDATLTPLLHNQLNNRHASSPNNYFLSAVWMSGAGISLSPEGALFFITGNSDPSGTTFDPPNNLQESVVSVHGDLSSVKSYFTPSGAINGQATLDREDADFGSGGVMIIPDLPATSVPNTFPKLAAAAGKKGQMYLLNREALGGYQAAGPDQVLSTSFVGRCWCAPSYFLGADGVRRVVSSGGRGIQIWQILNPATPALTPQTGSFATIQTGQDGGFFTTVSSNGTKAGTAIVWAVGRPIDANPAYVRLFAFDAAARTTNTPPLYSSVAGIWPNSNANANIVPVVANGKVYVASYKTLSIFGIGGHAVPTMSPQLSPQMSPQLLPQIGMQTRIASGVSLFGRITIIKGDLVTIRSADGVLINIDTRTAKASNEATVLVVGQAINARGFYSEQGVFTAEGVLRAKDDPALWH